MEMAEYFGVVRPTHPRPLHNAISTRNEGSACRGAGRRSPVLPPGKVFWRGGWVMQRSYLRIWFIQKKAPPKAGLFKMLALGGLAFAGLIGCDFFAGFLVDHLHGQTHLAAIIKA